MGIPVSSGLSTELGTVTTNVVRSRNFTLHKLNSFCSSMRLMAAGLKKPFETSLCSIFGNSRWRQKKRSTFHTCGRQRFKSVMDVVFERAHQFSFSLQNRLDDFLFSCIRTIGALLNFMQKDQMEVIQRHWCKYYVIVIGTCPFWLAHAKIYNSFLLRGKCGCGISALSRFWQEPLGPLLRKTVHCLYRSTRLQ